MEKKDYEEIEKNADILQRNASIKCNAEIQKAQNFYNGYQQGIEDLLKSIRRQRGITMTAGGKEQGNEIYD